VGGREDMDEGLYEIGLVLIFRNEAMDATHLAEFFQVEGVVADYDITLGHLIGTFILFILFSSS
jgi:phenylalanyl-tRNA synthetase alpha subunit